MTIDRSKRPPVSGFTHLHLDFPPQVTLSNGIKMWVIGDGDDDISRLSFFFDGGVLHEHKPMEAMLTAMTLTAGSSGRDAATIAEAFDYYGAWKQPGAYDAHTTLSITSLNDNLHGILPVLQECIEAPTFPEEEVEVLRAQLASNCDVAHQRVKYLALKEMKRLYYGDGHPLAMLATPQSIAGITTAHLVRFHREHFNPASCRLVLAGRVTDRELRIVDDVVGRWQPQGSPAPPVAWHINPSPLMHSIVHKPGGVQSAIVMTLPAIKRTHPHYLPLRLLVMALGGYFGSRLMTNIREQKGYTYGIAANLLGSAFDAYVGISTECATAHTWDVITEVKKELRRLREEPIGKEELNIVKQHILSSLAKQLDTPLSIGSYVATTILHGVYPEYYNRQVEAIMDATPAQLQDLACRYLNEDNLRTVIACDRTALPRPGLFD